MTQVKCNSNSNSNSSSDSTADNETVTDRYAHIFIKQAVCVLYVSCIF
jgi:hypothetical protein